MVRSITSGSLTIVLGFKPVPPVCLSDEIQDIIEPLLASTDFGVLFLERTTHPLVSLLMLLVSHGAF